MGMSFQQFRARGSANLDGAGRQQFGQVAHVVEHDSACSLQPRGRGKAAAVAEGPHVGGPSCLHPVCAVLDHRAPLGLYPHGTYGVLEKVGCRLVSTDVGRAEDAVLEVARQIGDLQASPNAGVINVRGDTDGSGEAPQNLCDAIDSGQFGIKGRLVEMLVSLLPALLQAPSESFLDSCGVDLGGRAHEPLDDFSFSERAPQVSRDHCVYFDAYPLAVHQHAVTVEEASRRTHLSNLSSSRTVGPPDVS